MKLIDLVISFSVLNALMRLLLFKKTSSLMLIKPNC